MEKILNKKRKKIVVFLAGILLVGCATQPLNTGTVTTLSPQQTTRTTVNSEIVASLNPLPTATSTITPSPLPSYNTIPCPAMVGYYCDENGVHYSPKPYEIPEATVIVGRVFDENNNLISGVKIAATPLEVNNGLTVEERETENGIYIIRNVPVGHTYEVTASKDKWKISKIVTLKSVLQGDLEVNTVNFFLFSGKIAYTSVANLSSIQDLFVINADGSNKVKVSESNIDNFRPVWSPDGSKLAYFTNGLGRHTIVTVNSDGTNRRTISTTENEWLSWSSDSQKLVYESEPDLQGNTEILTVNSDGSNLTPITEKSNTNHSPVWSPDGKRIAYLYRNVGGNDIYLINPDGSDKVKITNSDKNSSYQLPQWSPDSNKILTLDGFGMINIINTDGINQNEIKLSGYILSLPRWSPDSSKIVFDLTYSVIDNTNQKSNLYIINLDGTGLMQLTDNSSLNIFPSWSPDGKKISFISNSKLYVMNSDGTNQQRITHDLDGDSFSLWSPK
jgi:Tol biopolymer transport system component